jgi:DNA-binding response OmpR family regulator
MRIALLDDDDAQIEAVSNLLTSGGHSCHSFCTSNALLRALRNETYDLLILDWNVPDLPGVEVLNWSRRNLQTPPPALMLTARLDEADIVTGLNTGADDYVIKPVQPAVLLARVNALLRRAYGAVDTAPVQAHDDYLFNVPAQTVTVRGETVSLTSKEFALALFLFQNMHRALSRDHLLEAVWGRGPGLLTRTLDMHISRIRVKLGLRPEFGYRLTPVYSYGYRLEKLTGGAGATGGR